MPSAHEPDGDRDRLPVHVTPVNEQERALVLKLYEAIQAVTDNSV
jgi:hypothetical protein